VRILTLNCWNVSEPLAARMAIARDRIRALAPDVIGFQEIVVRGDGFDQTRLLLDGLGYEHVFGASFRWSRTGAILPPDHAGDAFGNAVASRWPIHRSESRALPGEATGEHRSVLAALVDTPAGTLPFFVTHLNWKLDHGWVRERQVMSLAEVVTELAAGTALPPIVVGDLNADPDATEVRFLCGLASLAGRSVYFQDAWRVAGDGGPGFTWDNRNPYAAGGFEPNRRIDYILVGLPDRLGRGRIRTARLAFTEPSGEVFASDHFGVFADVVMET
jgi:endonuclease/exonuclease/phosphatase family metal-dependent hydrolase